jgi:hypothetical protein
VVAGAVTDVAARGDDQHLDVTEVGAIVAVTSVAWVATVALALANADAFSTGAALALGALAPVAGLVWAWRIRRLVRVSAGGAVVVVVAAAIGAATLLPGFPYLVGDKDPGVYAAHALAIERTGGTSVPDPVLAAGDELPVTYYLVHRVPARFPGYWVDEDQPDRVRPQFFHLLPSLLAVAAGVGGTAALFNLVPVLAVLAVATLGLAVRRVAGTAAGALTAALLLANLMQVWHARHPATEILTEAFVAAAGLCLVLAVRAGRRPLAVLAGLLTAAAFLARPDGLAIVLLAFGAAMALLALRVRPDLGLRFFAGLGAGTPYALYQAYGLNRTYLLANDMPDWPVVVGLVVAVSFGAVALRWGADRWGDRARQALGDRDPRALLAGGVAVVAAVGLVLAWFRPDLFDLVMATTLDGRRIPRLDEYNLRKLSWFVTVPGLVAMWAGLWLALRRRSLTALWLAILPGAVLFPLYVWQAHIESRLMWWSRRFVPVILPAMAVLMAVAVAALLAHDGRRAKAVRAAGVVLGLFLVVAPLRQSLEVRGHREYGGSVELLEQIDEVVGPDALLLWQLPREGDPFDPSRNLGGPMWFVHDHASALLPEAPTDDDVAAHLAAFPDRRAFAVVRGDEPLPALDRYEPTVALRVQTALAHLAEADFEVPLEAGAIPIDVTVWELHRP